jgi:hypothetical protein
MRIPSSALRVRPRICRQSYSGQMLKPVVLRPGVLNMKSKMRQIPLGDRRQSGNEQVRKEIQSFLYALKSYPGRFARDPRITFAEHHGGLVRAASSASRRRA